MKTFCILTPTIPGRELLLERAMESVRNQTFGDYIHIIYGDGPNQKAKELCSQSRFFKTEYRETDKNYGGWGYVPRNNALNESPDIGSYWLFLDDDNYLFEDCLEVLSKKIGKSVLIYDMLYYSNIWQKWLILPPRYSVAANSPMRSKIDMGNFAVRWDIAKQIKFNNKVGNDFDYVSACCLLSNNDIEWIIGKPLLVYGFAPFGYVKNNQIIANFETIYT